MEAELLTVQAETIRKGFGDPRCLVPGAEQTTSGGKKATHEWGCVQAGAFPIQRNYARYYAHHTRRRIRPFAASIQQFTAKR